MGAKGSQEPIVYNGKLSSEHLARFSDFSCGDDKWDADLNDFLRENALQEGNARLNTTYVFYDRARRPIAYTALSTAQIQNQEKETENEDTEPIVDDAPYRTVSALLIGRLAVDQRHQGKGYGSVILAWIRDMALSLPVGCRFLALHVDKGNEAATRFYKKWGFFKPPYVKPYHRKQLMLYDLVRSPQAAS